MNLYLLPALKLIGLIATTFFGIAEHYNQRDKSPQSEARRRKWGIAAILISFSLAAGAELIDTIFKKQEAIEASKRAADAAEKTELIIGDLNRSLHPLMPFTVEARFLLNTKDPAFHSLRSKLINAVPPEEGNEWPKLYPGGPLFPDRNSDPMGFALLTNFPQARVFFTKGPVDTSITPERQPINLSFLLDYTSAPPTLRRDQLPTAGMKNRKYYYSDSGNVIIGFPLTKVTVTTAYSDGTIVAMNDLLGAQVRVELSPYFEVKPVNGIVNNRVVTDAIGLDDLEIRLPGTQVIDLRRERFKNLNVEKGMGHGYSYLFTFPKTEKELAKLIEL